MYVPTPRTYTYTHVCEHIHQCVHKCVCVCVLYTSVCACAHVCLNTCTYLRLAHVCVLVRLGAGVWLLGGGAQQGSAILCARAASRDPALTDTKSPGTAV